MADETTDPTKITDETTETTTSAFPTETPGAPTDVVGRIDGATDPTLSQDGALGAEATTPSEDGALGATDASPADGSSAPTPEEAPAEAAPAETAPAEAAPQDPVDAPAEILKATPEEVSEVTAENPTKGADAPDVAVDTAEGTTASNPSPSDSGSGSAASQGNDSITPPDAIVPNAGYHAPIEHPRPAQNPCRVDPMTGLPLPQEDQPEGASAQPDSGFGVVQDGNAGYEIEPCDEEEAAEFLEGAIGEYKDAERHKIEDALRLLRGAERHMSNILAELDGND